MPDNSQNNVLTTAEFFCGIGGFRLAADALNLQTVWANDIDAKAATVYMDNFNETNFHHGDIRQIVSDIPEHNILTAGFPCQPFSSAGKKKGIGDLRGTLFSEIVKILEIKQPDFLILENVKRLLSMDSGHHFLTILNALTQAGYVVEWRVLNAVWFGLPQYRERVILIGWKNHELRSYLHDSDVKSQNHSSLIRIKKSQIQRIQEHYYKFKNWGLAWDDLIFEENLESPPCQINSDIRLHHILELNPKPEFFFTEDTLRRIEQSEKVDRYFNGVEILYNQKGGARMGYSIFGVNGFAPTLTSTTSRHYERYKIDDQYRRLTNIEYARLQGFPDNHCRKISPYHQYKLYGNAVPPNLIKWVMSRLIQNNFSSVSLGQEDFNSQLELSFV
jgi:DNA (cytosine-5)-methyltransferase 1